MGQSLFDLTGKVAWVAGGAGYLGHAICHELASHGATVVICDQAKERADALAAELNGQGRISQAVSLDVSDEQALVSCGEAIVKTHGRLDIAINATFSAAGKPMDELGLDDWQNVMRVALGSAFLISRESARHMQAAKTGGSIIQFSSMYGLVSPDPSNYPPNLPINPIEYGVSKAGIIQMVRYQAAMWGKHGIRVNTIAPGPFPNTAGQGADSEFVKKLGSRTPLGRVGKPREIAGTVVWLASEAASYVTGTCVPVDGGWTAW